MGEFTKALQRSFAGGEIAPALHGRHDLVKHATGLKTCRNFQIKPQGNAANRPGTQFVKEVKDSTKAVRLIPFIFSTSQSYVLEFGDQYIRFHQDGGTVLETASNISGATQANPVVITDTGHTKSNGDEVYITGVVGMTELNGKYFTIANATANTYELVGIDGTGYTAYSSGGTSAAVYEIATTYLEADLFKLRFTQSADTMTITHPDYPVRELTRSGASSWAIANVVFQPTLSAPTGLSVSASGAPAGGLSTPTGFTASGGSDGFGGNWAVVAFNLTSVSDKATTSSANSDASLSWNSVAGATGYLVYQQVSGTYGLIDILSATSRGSTAGLPNAKAVHTPPALSTNFKTHNYVVTAVTASGEESLASSEDSISNDLTVSTAENDLTWNPVTGALRYYVYKEDNGLFGYIGQTPDTTFTDDNIEPDLTRSPPEDATDIESADNYPGVVTYFEQRRVFAATNNNPQSVFMTRPGTEDNLTNAIPASDTDSINFTVASTRLNQVVGMASVADLLLFTNQNVWKVTSQNSDAITPATIWVRVQDGKGSADLSPLTTGASVLYVQAAGSHIRDIQYTDAEVSYRSRDMSLMAPHLVEQFTIVDWDFASAPDDTVWAVRSDGTLLAFTYLPDQEVFAWHRHDTGASDNFESVCVVPENNLDIPYFLVERTINGGTKRYIERLHDRYFATIEDAFFVDSGLTVTGSAFTTISGLDHLEGMTVAILADGDVYSDYVVSGGEITLPNAVDKAHVGLPIQSDLETLPLATEAMAAQGAGIEKNVERVHLRVNKTRGVFAGPNFDDLVEYAQRTDELWGDPVATVTGEIEIPVTPDWVRDGHVAIRQNDPLPVEILSMAIDTAVEG